MHLRPPGGIRRCQYTLHNWAQHHSGLEKSEMTPVHVRTGWVACTIAQLGDSDQACDEDRIECTRDKT